MRSLRAYTREFIRRIYAQKLLHKIDTISPEGAIEIDRPFVPVRLQKGAGARIVLNGKLKFSSYLDGQDTVLIRLGRNSELIIDGDFEIGHGSQIILDDNAQLYIGGRKKESSSGITERARIMVKHKSHIGMDCIFSWNVYITDCDWHSIDGNSCQKDVIIGDHVWVGPNATILKGSTISNGSVIAAGGVVAGYIPEMSLAGGVPTRVLKSPILWSRDMKE